VGVGGVAPTYALHCAAAYGTNGGPENSYVGVRRNPVPTTMVSLAGGGEPRHVHAMPNYRRFFSPGRMTFLTLVTRGRQPWLRADTSKQCVLAAFADTRLRHPFRNVGHVVLDDHLHWMLVPGADTDISRLVAAFKQWVIRASSDIGGDRALWQRRFYDHVIRDEDDMNRHLDYIHYNPVKHGYCTRAGDYRWSSFAAWCKRGAYDARWGAIEPVEARTLRVE
jgi:putative transposase